MQGSSAGWQQSYNSECEAEELFKVDEYSKEDLLCFFVFFFFLLVFYMFLCMKKIFKNQKR